MAMQATQMNHCLMTSSTLWYHHLTISDDVNPIVFIWLACSAILVTYIPYYAWHIVLLNFVKKKVAKFLTIFGIDCTVKNQSKNSKSTSQHWDLNVRLKFESNVILPDFFFLCVRHININQFSDLFTITFWAKFA